VKQKLRLQNAIVLPKLMLDTCHNMEVWLLHNSRLSSSNIISISNTNSINSISESNINNINSIKLSSSSTSTSNNLVATQALTHQQASYRLQVHLNKCHNTYPNTGALALRSLVCKALAVWYGINPSIIRTKVFHQCNSNRLLHSNNSSRDRLLGHMDHKDLKGIEGINMGL
jgi:hypothetical protein